MASPGCGTDYTWARREFLNLFLEKGSFEPLTFGFYAVVYSLIRLTRTRPRCLPPPHTTGFVGDVICQRSSVFGALDQLSYEPDTLLTQGLLRQNGRWQPTVSFFPVRVDDIILTYYSQPHGLPPALEPRVSSADPSGQQRIVSVFGTVTCHVGIRRCPRAEKGPAELRARYTIGCRNRLKYQQLSLNGDTFINLMVYGDMHMERFITLWCL